MPCTPDLQGHLPDRYLAASAQTFLRTALNVQWEFFPKLSPEEFDADKSLHNQARFQPIDEKRVETYVEAMKRGDEFPPVIAHGKLGKLVQADGNHRLQAAIKAKKPLDTYVISGPAQTIVAITFEANSKPAGRRLRPYQPPNAGYEDHGVSAPKRPCAGCFRTAETLAAQVLSEYSGRTAEAYGSDLRCWLLACPALGCCPVHASRHDLQRYLRHLERAGLAPSSRARRLSGISCLFRLAREQGLLQHDPCQHLRRPRRTAVVNRAGLTPAEVAALLAAAQEHSPRAQVLIGLQALNGLRVSEVLSIRLEQVGMSQGHRVVHLVGKGGKPALVPLPAMATSAVTAAAAGRSRGPLVVTRTGKPMDRRAASRLVTRLGEVAGITTGRVHCHALRAAWVTNALRAGVPLHVVQDGARHSDPRQTRLYDRAINALDGHAAYTVADIIEVAGGRGTGAAGKPMRLPQLVVPSAGQRHDERELGGEQDTVVVADEVEFSSLP